MHPIFRGHISWLRRHQAAVVAFRSTKGRACADSAPRGCGAAATVTERPSTPYSTSHFARAPAPLSSSSNSLSRSFQNGTVGSHGGCIGSSHSSRVLRSQTRATATQVTVPPATSAPKAMEATDEIPAALPKAYVRAPPGAETLVVTVTLGSKTCNLNRPTDEPLDKALLRLAKNLAARPSKKEKRKKPLGPPPGAAAGGSGADPSTDDPSPLHAVLYEDTEGSRPVDRSLPNGEAWLQGVLLEVAGARFQVEVNPPTVDKLSIDRLAMVGYPTAAAVTLSHADPGACWWRWSAQRPGAGGGWEDLGCSSQYYTPTPADEGSILRVECTPAVSGRGRWTRGRRGQQREGDCGADGGGGAVAAGTDTAIAVEGEDGGEEELWLGESVSVLTGPVHRGPATCSTTIRCVHTPTAVQPPGFRIVSYNILADQYAGSDYAQNVLFNYCPKECLDPGYRRPLVLRELLGYHADVICLQEVDERAFTDFLSLHLGLQGYRGHYTNKQGKVREGSATFWRTARFTALAHRDIRLREAFARPLPPLHNQFEPLLVASRELETALQQVTTIAQATLLAPSGPADPPGGAGPAGGPGGCLCIVNTHLFFHPYAPHIRTMHTAAILEEVAAFLQQCAADPAMAGALSGVRPTVLFVGDLNSDLNDGIPGVVELLRRGKLPADYWDWVQGAAFKWGMGEEDAEAMAQGTAQIAAAAAATSSQPTAASDANSAAAADTKDSAAASASLSSLFTADGHAFDSAAAAPHSPITVTGIDITAPFVLRSADDLATPYTNYTSGYKALLDYVWYEESVLRVVRAVPIPSEAELGSFIPSPAFPSDHLAVVYDMEWLHENGQ